MVIAILVIVSLIFLELWGRNLEEEKKRKEEKKQDY